MTEEPKDETTKLKPSDELVELVHKKKWRVVRNLPAQSFGHVPTNDELRAYYAQYKLGGVRK